MKRKTLLIIVIVCICAVLAVLWVISLPRGTEEKIDVTKDAYAILENGEKIDCTVRFLGTLYIDSPKVTIDQFTGGYDGGIWIGEKQVLQHYVFVDAEKPVVLGSDHGYFYLSQDMSVFVAKVDAAYLQLDVEQQNVFVVLKENTAEQYEPIIAEMEKKSS